MFRIVQGLLQPVLVAAMAILMSYCNQGCKSVENPNLSEAYQAELLACVGASATPKASCECRKSVDMKWDVCTNWPDQGRCKTVCQ